MNARTLLSWFVALLFVMNVRAPLPVCQIAVVESISSLLFLLGKVCITAACGLLGFAWFQRAPNYKEGAFSWCVRARDTE